MKVVLDTNILVGDYNFKKPAAKILLKQSKKRMLDVYIPEVVLDETTNKFRQRMLQAQNNINGELQTVNNLTDGELISPLSGTFVEVSVSDYRGRLENLFAEHSIKIIPYPITDHKTLARKAMLKKKPFNSNEKGYRDNLIWENVKSLISSSDIEIASKPELVFVTDNHTDFMSGESLHDDLINELEEQDLQTETISVYRSLQDFSDKVMKLYLVQAKTFEGKLNKNEFWDFQLKEIITEYLYKNYVGKNLEQFEFVSPGDYAEDDREIESFNEDFEITALQVKKLSADEFVVDLKVDLETELEFFLDKGEFYSNDDDSYHVIDYDWNDHVMLVNTTEDIAFGITLIINSQLECLSIEMTKID